MRLIALLLGLTLCLRVGAQTADMPTYAIGDTWTYLETDLLTGNRLAELKYEVTTVQGGRTQRTLSRDGVVSTGWWNPDLSFSGFQVFKWPLTVGSQWKSTLVRNNPQCGKMTDTLDAEVKAYEELKTPAGTFQVFLVVHSGIYSFEVPGPYCANGRRVWSYWYSPEVKRIVRFEEHWGSTHMRQELAAYRVTR